MDQYEPMEQPTKMRSFTAWVILAQIFGLAAVVLVAVWMGQYNGGFAWQEDPAREFNYHPLFMVIGLIFLYGDAILVYRVFRNERKIYVKILHALLHVFALIFAAVGLKAVFDSHNLPAKKIPNLYSLHSWVGLATVILFGLQWLVGFFSFLWPGFSMEMRGRYKSVHVFFGLALFIMATATALMGITEKMLFKKTYNKPGGEGILVNILGAVLVILALIVVYVVSNPNYSRQPLPEEDHIELTGERTNGSIQE